MTITLYFRHIIRAQGRRQRRGGGHFTFLQSKKKEKVLMIKKKKWNTNYNKAISTLGFFVNKEIATGFDGWLEFQRIPQSLQNTLLPRSTKIRILIDTVNSNFDTLK